MAFPDLEDIRVRALEFAARGVGAERGQGIEAAYFSYVGGAMLVAASQRLRSAQQVGVAAAEGATGLASAFSLQDWTTASDHREESAKIGGEL